MKCFNSCRLATMWQQYTRKYCWANLRNLFLKSLIRTSVQSTCLARYAVLGPFTPSVSFVWRCFEGQTTSAPLSYMSGPQVNWAPGSDLVQLRTLCFLGESEDADKETLLIEPCRLTDARWLAQ